jgi:trimeric autotransporter adhesin
MKYFLTILFCFGVAGFGRAQSVGIGTSTPNSSAQLDISSSTRGLLIPRIDTSGLKAIVNPGKGLMVYDTTLGQLLVNTGTPSSPNWINLIENSGWSLTGNDPSFAPKLGTLGGYGFSFVSGNKYAGGLDDIDGTVSFGTGVFSNLDQQGNFVSGDVAIGFNALQNGGYLNTAIGGAAMQNSQGSDCIGLGANSLANNTGSDCVGIGWLALNKNSGFYNIGVGSETLESSSGTHNIAVGFSAGSNTTSGSNNVVMGSYAFQANTTGANNTVVGDEAFWSNSTGVSNTAVGSAALSLTTQSSYNTVVGYNSGSGYDNGYNNVFVGANNDVNGAGYYNVIAIGQGVICTTSDQAVIGNSATNSIGGYADWTNFSDGRYKKNMRENVKGLDFIMKLRPITYNLDVTGIRNHLGQKAPADAGTQRSIASREEEVLSGFAAQEVEQAAAAAGYDFSGVDKPKNANAFYGLRYGDFVVPLVKAVQEQQAMIKALQDEVAELKKQLQH